MSVLTASACGRTSASPSRCKSLRTRHSSGGDLTTDLAAGHGSVTPPLNFGPRVFACRSRLCPAWVQHPSPALSAKSSNSKCAFALRGFEVSLPLAGHNQPFRSKPSLAFALNRVGGRSPGCICSDPGRVKVRNDVAPLLVPRGYVDDFAARMGTIDPQLGS
jgi:hypothetical protein